MSSKGAVGGPCRGSPCPGGVGHPMADPSRLRGSAMAQPHSRAPLFFNDTAAPEIYSLSLHDALPIFRGFSRSTEVGSMRFLNRCEAIIDTDTTVLVS